VLVVVLVCADHGLVAVALFELLPVPILSAWPRAGLTKVSHLRLRFASPPFFTTTLKLMLIVSSPPRIFLTTSGAPKGDVIPKTALAEETYLMSNLNPNPYLHFFFYIREKNHSRRNQGPLNITSRFSHGHLSSSNLLFLHNLFPFSL